MPLNKETKPNLIDLQEIEIKILTLFGICKFTDQNMADRSPFNISALHNTQLGVNIKSQDPIISTMEFFLTRFSKIIDNSVWII